MKTVALVGTFDSKGAEYLYVKGLLNDVGIDVFTIHSGVFESAFTPDVSNAEVARAAGEDIEELARAKDRARATATLSKGIEILLPKLFGEGKFDGVLSFGGSGGTSIVTPGMRALPIGVPKIMVSTMAAGDVSVYVGTSDIIMYPSIVDVAGLNSLSMKIFSNAAHAMAGMLKFEARQQVEKKPLVAATMFGVTTPCVDAAREYLEERGYEVLVFHATGAGGKTMESLIASGFFEGVLDLTTTEWCDELFGGILAAGKERMDAAAKCGVPQVVSVGALDMVNFGPYDSVPKKYKGRNFYRHNPTTTLMRTTQEENKQLGRVIAQKINKSTGPAALMLPLGGVSMIDKEGEPFHGKEEDAALFEVIREHIDPERVELIEMDCHINDAQFGRAAAQKLIDEINCKKEK
ncbi:MAG: Tm-1-like ATP-binding domain-containing protein [Christensenella sp.]|uniref:Tm-1-like ATP-binding domain-containing protein n=1 Tax=Christensenella sp. TaxID=1935934 RepID=UPI002B1F07C0|nr:Tm-1-like ATP-binding domain-containing protein [Christensenella sp.]MEA5002218.1 Tm-1-like ATP-binding domain-containing protein [Christensenella sp.]